ncbi:MAG: hypothetical protein LBQ08_02370 [Holosporaceae bacterium]|jgi:hypothetical protein|nr:hypothetical protein [Holosporaceae bacterium]
MPKKAIIFLPETGIYPYLRTLSVLGDALKKDGYEVFLTNCDGISFRCPMMPNRQMPLVVFEEQKREKCYECQKYLNNAREAYDFNVLNLKDYADEQLFKTLDNFITAEKWETLEYKGLKVGQIAIHDLMLEAKVLTTKNLSREQKHLYGNYIKNTAMIVELMDRIIKKIKPNLILAYNPYAQCQAVLYACQINGINFKGITNAHHLGANFSLFQFTNHTFMREYLYHCTSWNNEKNPPISCKMVQICFDDAVFRMYGSGSHIFSSAKVSDMENIYSELNLDKTKKIIGVFTSSNDERQGISFFLKAWNQPFDIDEVFDSQIEWFKFLKEFAEKNKNDLQIVVRVHPREGRNGGSENLEFLKKKLLGQDNESFKIIWPDNPISSYDLMEIIDCCLISSSTVGLECQRLGIPTLSHTRKFSYPDEGLIEIAHNRESYEKKLNKIINYNCSIKEIINSCRFYNWRILINSLDMGETIPRDFTDDSIYPPAPLDRQKLVVDILENKIDLIKYNIEHLRQANYSEKEELESVKLGIRRVIDRLFLPSPQTRKKVFYERWLNNLKKRLRPPPDGIFKDYDLKYSEDVSRLDDFLKESRKNNTVYLVKDGIYSILVKNGVVQKRCSKMVANLARIHEEADG